MSTAQPTAKAVTRLRIRPPPPRKQGPRPTKLEPAFRPVPASQLVSSQGNGYNLYVPPLRKLVFEYCERSEQSARTRSYLLTHVEDLARANPHVEVVVKTRSHKPPVVRGLYLNNRDKVISLIGLEENGIVSKVKLILESTGAKIKPLKRDPVVSVTPSARGIWSSLHEQNPYDI
ncbi:SubName: Full=Uncharacterized protein {ECO:0000313/EMBL:CCA70049.1} [Serendipita indica DSM 11827]|uniref:Large ribosomal subunit protein mL43 n=1 Tax=Serendipita indica (strain DSM 11827) TaxID=1109443 RepID=G4TFF6_SERID|nr:SubName: Full=Uncharacterized protein {ECO:0000313/EMBL:CCA70049.1} [Serendipita indica DSM 11827]CCA70049.1 hypothetical protein PIIN_03989 [Serendipita indica DSM 11827]